MGAIDDYLGTSFFGPNSTDRATSAQVGASREANDLQRYMYDQQRADAQPWLEAGTGALQDMRNADLWTNFSADKFEKSPGYDFRLQEGLKAVNNAASARGNIDSGANMKALTRYGQGFASNEYENAYNRYNTDQNRQFNQLSSIAGLGQVSNQQVSQAGQNYANVASGNIVGRGNAIAGGNIARGNRNVQLVDSGIQYGAMFSDERLKTDLKLVSESDLKDMRKHLKAFAFKYKSEMYGKGKWVGVMAQDLEKSPLGKLLVFEDKDGLKVIDKNKVMSLFLATMAVG